MEPISRPEWSSPQVGVHASSFYSALPEQPTREVLQALCDDPKLLSFLERRGLGRLEFSGRLPASNWNGEYDRSTGDIVVNAFRAPDTYGEEFVSLGLASVSGAGRNLVEAMQRSLYHEIGHHVLEVAGPDIVLQTERLLRSGKAFPLSRRARRWGAEYFSESFAAYRFEDSLADKDPEGYDMVETVLRLVAQK